MTVQELEIKQGILQSRLEESEKALAAMGITNETEFEEFLKTAESNKAKLTEENAELEIKAKELETQIEELTK